MIVQPYKWVKTETSLGYSKEETGPATKLLAFGVGSEDGDNYTTGVYEEEDGFLAELPVNLLKVIEHDKK